MSKRITSNDAKELAAKLGKNCVIVYAFNANSDELELAGYGKDYALCNLAKVLGDAGMDAMLEKPWRRLAYRDKTGASTAIADRAAHKAEEIEAILAEARGEAR